MWLTLYNGLKLYLNLFSYFHQPVFSQIISSIFILLYLMRIFMFDVNTKIDKYKVTTLDIILPKCVCIREWHKLLFRLFTRVIKLLVQIDSICSILQIQFQIPIVLLLFLEMNWVAEHIENYIPIKYPNSSFSMLKMNWLDEL